MRLRHAQLPEEAREVEKELRKIQKEKDGCVRTQVPPAHPASCLTAYGMSSLAVTVPCGAA